MGLSVILWDKYNSLIDKDNLRVIEAVVGALKKSPFFLELKLYILDKFLPPNDDSGL